MRLLFLALLITILNACFAQKNFVPGYVITNSGDTVRGRINYQGWTHNPRSIQFQLAEGAETRDYTVNNLRSFEVTGKDNYRSAVVQRSTKPIDISQLKVGYSDTVLTDTVFLRLVVKGKWNLFELNVNKSIFYLQVDDGPIEELRYVVDLQESNQYFSERYYFRNQINGKLFTAGADKKLSRSVVSLNYNEIELRKFIEGVNQSISGSGNELVIHKTKLFSFYAGVSAAINTMSMKGEGDARVDALSFKGSVSPAIQAGVNISSGRNLQRLMGRVELCYYNFNITGSGTIPETYYPGSALDYTLKMSDFRTSFNLLYNVVDYPAFKTFLGVGYGFHLTNTKTSILVDTRTDNNKYVTDPFFEMDKFWWQGMLKAGVLVKDHWEAGLNYSIVNNFTRGVYYKVDPQTIQLQLNYRF
jgi:hypothetical protein